MANSRGRPKKGGSVEVDLGNLNPKQQEFYDSRALYTCYGGAKGGGKTHAIRIKAIIGAMKYQGIRILIIRRAYNELQQNHIEPVLNLVPPQVAEYNGTVHCLYFYNGSTIKFGHYQSSTAEQEYQGQEYDWIFMDEATQFTEREFRYLGGCLRGVNKIPKQFFITCNPGGVGHRWVKRLFIDKKYKSDSKNPEENENPKDYKFIFATVEDNTAMKEADPVGYKNYLSSLMAMPNSAAYRYGDWSQMGGNYFPEFSEAKHVIRPFKIPDEWIRYRAFDYGLDMLACYWIAIDPGGRCYVYRELKQPNLIVSDAANLIISCTLPQEHIAITFAPPDMWNRQKDTGKTMAELFMLNDVPIVRADNNRVQGHMQIKEMLNDLPDGKPALLFFNNCKDIISDIQDIQADENNPNDCAKNPHEITHTVDGLRYFCISRTMPTEIVPKVEYYDEDFEEDYDTFMTGGEPTAAYLAG